MSVLSRWFAPVVLAAGFGAVALAPTPAHADDELVRIIVDAADVILRGGEPYYRHGDDRRLVVGRDRYGRPVYYRDAPRYDPRAYDRDRRHSHRYDDRRDRRHDRRNVRCDSRGRCTAQYYDPRYDRDRRRWR
ncbi:hypothetical protein [Luteimonas huabeiensis]|uniref:hypothetical protein n=1 Tax=Luteimonas huabeiensis TaxID=1244513 RepID=UPI0004658B69|nr:hypothetical protein [Luteimonas huabeiensis]